MLCCVTKFGSSCRMYEIRCPVLAGCAFDCASVRCSFFKVIFLIISLEEYTEPTQPNPTRTLSPFYLIYIFCRLLFESCSSISSNSTHGIRLIMHYILL